MGLTWSILRVISHTPSLPVRRTLPDAETAELKSPQEAWATQEDDLPVPRWIDCADINQRNFCTETTDVTTNRACARRAPFVCLPESTLYVLAQLMFRFTLLLILLAMHADLVRGQGQPYTSPFSSYRYTTSALLQPQPGAAAAVPAGQPYSTRLPQQLSRQTQQSWIGNTPPTAFGPQPSLGGHAPILSNGPAQSARQRVFRTSGTCQDCSPAPPTGIQPQAGGPLYGHAGPLPAYGQFAQPDFQGYTECEPNVCESCCSSPCDERGRRYAFDVNAVFMFRQRPQGQRLFFNPSVATEHIDASQFSPGGAYGLESAFIIYDQNSFTDLEFRALWLNDWDSRVERAFTGVSVQLDSNPVLGTTGPRNGASFLGSQLGSMEFNARYRLDEGTRGITLVGGFRHIQLQENLNTTLADPGGIVPDELIRTAVNNRLYGLQLGVDSVIANRERCCLKLNSRVGLLGNIANQRTQLISLSSPPVTFNTTGEQGDLALLVECGVSGKIRLTSRANLIAGYRAIFIDGLALATEQLAATSFLNGAGMHHNGSLMLHAVNVGVEVAY